MTAKPSQMERIEKLVRDLCAPVDLGTAQQRRRYELALRRADEWVADSQPPKGGIRGGSTSPAVAEEQSEDRAVSRMALSARSEIHARMNEAERALKLLSGIVTRLTVTVDPSKLPPDPGTYCVNCMTVNHHEDVTVKAPKSGLCNFCYESKRAYGFLPPAEIIKMRPEGRTSAAMGRALAEIARLRAKGSAA